MGRAAWPACPAAGAAAPADEPVDEAAEGCVEEACVAGAWVAGAWVAVVGGVEFKAVCVLQPASANAAISPETAGNKLFTVS